MFELFIAYERIKKENIIAELTEIDRAYIHKKFMSEESNLRENMALSKIDIRAAINETDTWIEDNQASFNQALPITARTNLTARQKVLLFMYVANRRWEVI